MTNSLNTPNNAFQHKRQRKDKNFQSQLEVVKFYLKDHDSSRYMIAVSTQIPIQNVCRHVDNLFKSDLVAIVRKGKCNISGEWVEFLTTDPDKFPISNQLSLFRNEGI